MAHTKYSNKFYWLIHKTSGDINIASQDKYETRYSAMEILGYEEPRQTSWVTQHFHIIELKVPNEIIQFKTPS